MIVEISSIKSLVFHKISKSTNPLPCLFDRYSNLIFPKQIFKFNHNKSTVIYKLKSSP